MQWSPPEARELEPRPGCNCETCKPNTFMWNDTSSLIRFIVCEHCGNKRCPHATDHRFACTGSNEPGQRGTVAE